MRNRLWKKLASAMAGLMVVGSMQAAVLPVMAQDGAAGAEIAGETADSKGTVSGGSAQEEPDFTVSGNGNLLNTMNNKTLWNLEPARDVTENILADFNTGFEGASAEGKLYWWNNAEWNQSTIPRAAYENGEQPDSSCGNYYVQVNPTAD